jgi:hypothetical protein
MINRIIAYEQGELNDDETLELFAELIRNRMAWSLQGHYGRTAASLIKSGHINSNGKILKYIEE